MNVCNVLSRLFYFCCCCCCYLVDRPEWANIELKKKVKGVIPKVNFPVEQLIIVHDGESSLMKQQMRQVNDWLFYLAPLFNWRYFTFSPPRCTLFSFEENAVCFVFLSFPVSLHLKHTYIRCYTIAHTTCKVDGAIKG